ncbi:MAG: DUF2239 family protein [Chromatiales bacterium]|nr:DUF2239 family protein [Chromatiales bacterium]
MTKPLECVGFIDGCISLRGDFEVVALRCWQARNDNGASRVAIYDDQTGQPIDVDYSGAKSDFIAHLANHPLLRSEEAERRQPRGRGRPRLGVVSREISLLPRHWTWLQTQRGGASAALRRLVDEARKAQGPGVSKPEAIDAAHRFMWDIAGDAPGFEEAARALYAENFDKLDEIIVDWPAGVREQLARLLNRGIVDHE